MAQFDRQIATAVRLIAKYGQAVTWQIVNDGTPADAAKPWKPSEATDTSNTVTICFVPIRENDWRKLLMYLKGTEVPIGRLAGLMAGNVAFEPKLKDVVVRDNVTLHVSSVDLISPNGQKILYVLEFEG
jgi:hypothetical protein